MGLYNFEPRFVPFILDGRKRHTIRGIRKYADVPGNTMHLFIGLRHPGARCLMRPPCVKRENIVITPGGQVRVDDQWLADDERESLARADGFSSFAEMLQFWREPKDRLPFKGHILHWRFQ